MTKHQRDKEKKSFRRVRPVARKLSVRRLGRVALGGGGDEDCSHLPTGGGHPAEWRDLPVLHQTGGCNSNRQLPLPPGQEGELVPYSKHLIFFGLIHGQT